MACLASLQSLSQSAINSVYSRYGLGLLEPVGTITHAGMGGACTAVSDGIAINYANPASYSFLDVTTLQVGGRGSFSKMTTDQSSQKILGGQVNEMGFGFKKPGSKWGIAVGVTSFSKVDYSFSSTQALNDSVNANYNYTGSGGLNRALIGVSRSFRFSTVKTKKSTSSTSAPEDSLSVGIHQFSFGINLNYLFGNINRTNKVAYDYALFFASTDYNNLFTQGYALEGGLLYKFNFGARIDETKRLRKGSSITIGLDYVHNASLPTTYERLITIADTIGTTIFRDTSYFNDGERGRLKLPKKISFGITWRHFNKKSGTFIISADAKFQDWSKYELAMPTDVNLDDGLKSSQNFSLGIEYRPSLDVSSDFFHRVYYRIGARHLNSSLAIKDYQFTQQGITAGLSIPVIKSSSKLHLAAEYGMSGTTDMGLVKENYWNFSVGFTLTPSIFDRWFRQIKYD